MIYRPIEVRIVGSLLEKEVTTPEYYPLSLNALTLACNQKSNRDPVMSLTDETVAATLESLRGRGLVVFVHETGSRVEKYRQRLSEVLNLDRRELAILCVLMLRGFQTVGELRERTQRLYAFDDLAAVESCLNRMMERSPAPLAVKLPRADRKQRAALCPSSLRGSGSCETETPRYRVRPSWSPSQVERIGALESEVAALRQEVADLREQLAEFRKQFE